MIFRRRGLRQKWQIRRSSNSQQKVFAHSQTMLDIWLVLSALWKEPGKTDGLFGLTPVTPSGIISASGLTSLIHWVRGLGWCHTVLTQKNGDSFIDSCRQLARPKSNSAGFMLISVVPEHMLSSFLYGCWMKSCWLHAGWSFAQARASAQKG